MEPKAIVVCGNTVEIILNKSHMLLIHRTDEGIVLDVWRDTNDEEPVFSTYFFDDELMPEEETDGA